MLNKWRIETNNITRLLECGERVYHQLLDARTDETDLIICPRHLGDTIWIVVFARSYIESHQCKYVYFVVKESQKDMVSLFPDVAGIISLTNDEMLALSIFIAVTELRSDNHIVYAHYPENIEYKNNSFRLSYNSEGDFCTMKELRIKWLGISEDAVPSRMNPMDDEDDELIELFGRAVLLIPIAQSIKCLPNDFWRKLANKYTNEGYVVYTNYNGLEYEELIEGTMPLSSSLTELAQIAPYFSRIISLRNGTGDLIAETTAKLSIIYHAELPEKGVILEPNDVKWDSISELNGRAEIHYYQYLPDKEDELITALVGEI